MSLPRSTSVGPASSERLGQEDTTREAHNSDHSSAASLWRWRVLRLQKQLVGTGPGETQCWTGGQSVGDHLGGGDDHRLCGLADRILWLKSTFALMAKARLKKTDASQVDSTPEHRIRIKESLNQTARDSKEKRERFKQLAQTQKLKSRRAFAAEVRRSNIQLSNFSQRSASTLLKPIKHRTSYVRVCLVLVVACPN